MSRCVSQRSDATGRGESFRLWQSDALPQIGYVDHRWVVLHNPHCPYPIPDSIWGSCPQFIRDGDGMRWSDGDTVDA